MYPRGETRAKNIGVERASPLPWTMLPLTYAPIVLMIGFWIFIMRQMQSGGNKALRSAELRQLRRAQKKVTFKDVAGAD